MQTILIIEDQPELASVIRLVVSRQGHRALLALTLAEAEAIWTALKQEITIVISDNHLPDGSGVHFVNRLYSEKPEIKLILASGLPDPAIPPGAYRLDKPFEIAALTALLDRLAQESG